MVISTFFITTWRTPALTATSVAHTCAKWFWKIYTVEMPMQHSPANNRTSQEENSYFLRSKKQPGINTGAIPRTEQGTWQNSGHGDITVQQDKNSSQPGQFSQDNILVTPASRPGMRELFYANSAPLLQNNTSVRPQYQQNGGPNGVYTDFTLPPPRLNTVVSNNSNRAINLENVNQDTSKDSNNYVDTTKIDSQVITKIVSQVLATMLQNGQLPNTSKVNPNIIPSNITLSNITNPRNNNNSVEESIKKFNSLEINKRLPVFDNKGTVHPLDFLEQLEYYHNLDQVPFQFFRYVIANQFKGDASWWSQAHLHKFSNFAEFKVAFKDFFWSEYIQSEVMHTLEKDKYDPSMGSFVQHFMRGVALARHLSSIYPEHFIIQKLARNYPPHIATNLIGTRNFSEAIARLRQAEYYFPADGTFFDNRTQISRPEASRQRFDENKNNAYSPAYSRDRSNYKNHFYNHKNKNVSVLEVDKCTTEDEQNAGNEEVPHLN